MRTFPHAVLVGAMITLGGCATAYVEPGWSDAPPLITGPRADPVAKAENTAGIKAYRAGHFAIAEEHFQAAVHAAPSIAEPHYNLALALIKLENPKLAKLHFQMAGQLAPENTAIIESTVYKRSVGESPGESP